MSRPFLYAYISYSAPPKAEKTNVIKTVLMSFDCAFKIPLSFLSLSRIYALICLSLIMRTFSFPPSFYFEFFLKNTSTLRCTINHTSKEQSKTYGHLYSKERER
jgi:hypothetical protein